MRKWLIIFFLFAISVSSYAKIIKIAVLSESPNSDLDAPTYLEDIPIACQLAVEEKKSELLKKNLYVQLVPILFQPTPIAPYQMLEKVYHSDAIAAVGFQSSDEVLTSASVITGSKFLAVSPYASANKVFNLKPNYLTLSFSNLEAIQAMEQFIISLPQHKKIMAIVAWDSPYSKNFYESFSQNFKEKVTLFKTFDDLHDFMFMTDRIKREKPDIIILPNFPVNTASIIRILSKMGMHSIFVGGDSWGEGVDDNRFLSIVNDITFTGYTLRAYSSFHKSAEQEQFSQQLYKQTHGYYSVTAGLYHDATLYLLNLLLKSNKNITREQLLKLSQQYTTINGVMGLNCLSQKNCHHRQWLILKVNQKGFFYDSTLNLKYEKNN